MGRTDDRARTKGPNGTDGRQGEGQKVQMGRTDDRARTKGPNGTDGRQGEDKRSKWDGRTTGRGTKGPNGTGGRQGEGQKVKMGRTDDRARDKRSKWDGRTTGRGTKGPNGTDGRQGEDKRSKWDGRTTGRGTKGPNRTGGRQGEGQKVKMGRTDDRARDKRSKWDGRTTGRGTKGPNGTDGRQGEGQKVQMGRTDDRARDKRSKWDGRTTGRGTKGPNGTDGRQGEDKSLPMNSLPRDWTIGQWTFRQKNTQKIKKMPSPKGTDCAIARKKENRQKKRNIIGLIFAFLGFGLRIVWWSDHMEVNTTRTDLAQQVIWPIACVENHSQNEKSLCPTLIYYLLFLLISLISAVAYHCYMVANFLQNGAEKADPYWMFWLALCYECANVAVPVAILGLTIDRCLTITFPLSYGRRAKRMLLFADVLFSVLLFLVTFRIYFVELPLDVSQLSELCLNASCVNMRNRNLYRLGAKSLFGFVNIIASLIFMVLMRANRVLMKNSTARQKASRNRMVAITLTCETVFNILPNMVAFFANILLGIILSNYLGWITMVGYSLDSFVMSIFYFIILFGRQQKLIVAKNVAKVAPANPRQNAIR
ncbi:hypothetical protein niasHT_006914 [Heterodera trifolii]|uniref:G-protein coupled receptors family 1 profile domain-containing protein n=1 Tax=Heterodera trifolii TaxID=157864 RepID=A0ABD2LMM0_9BILA